MDECPSEEPEAEGESLNQIAPEEPTGLVAETVHPLETEALHRRGCARLIPDEEAERHSGADEPGSGHLGSEQGDQVFLLRKAEPKQHQGGLCDVEHFLNPVKLPRIVFESKRRAVGVDAGKTGKLRSESLGCSRRDAGIPPQEKDGHSSLGGRLWQAKYEIAPSDPLGHRCAGQSRSPNDRHPIRNAMAGGEDQLSACEIRSESPQDFEIRRYDPPALPCSDPIQEEVHKRA